MNIPQAVQDLVDDFKAFAETDPGELALQCQQRILEAKVHELQCKQKDTKTKAGNIMQEIVSSKSITRKLLAKDTPLEFLIDVYNNTDIDIDSRIKAATTAIPYIHRKLPNQVEHTGEGGGAIEFNHTEARDKLASFLFQSAIEGEIVEEDDSDDE